ncbi:MAG: TIGR04219 family outer membrane beta-barrel protein [Pseudomonadota bacterium]
MNLVHATKISSLALSLVCFSSTATADTVFGIYAGAGGWQQEFSGEVTSTSVDVDVETDLGIEDDTNNVFYVAVEHGLPILPNLRGQHFEVNVDGDNVLSRTIDFNGQSFTLNDSVVSELELSQSDAVMYYEVLDNVVSVDVGLVVSFLEGSISVASSTETAAADFDEVVPMLYSKVRADLPLTGFWVGAEGQGVSYDGNSLIEFNTQVGWESPLGLGLEAGWRAVHLEMDSFDEVESAELDITGPYASVNYHF